MGKPSRTYPTSKRDAPDSKKSLLSHHHITAIKPHKKDTAPGMTGFSYRHLKTLPEDFHKATYNMLCTLWPTQQIPEYWKQRWL